MSENFSATLKTFSDKHGALLLGMHHELKAMQVSVDESKLALENAQDLSARVNLNLTNQQAELRIFTKTALQEQIRMQTISKQLDAKVISFSETARIRFEGLTKKVDDYIEAQMEDLRAYKISLDTKQLEVRKLHEASLSLLKEQKAREITHQQKVEQLGRTLNKIGFSILMALVLGIISIWAFKWMH